MSGKNILIGITGSIAAYKSAYIVRLFVKNGYNVKVVMTQSATDFISPLTLSTLSKNDVYVKFSEDGKWNNHVDLGIWADVFLIAPITANTIAKMASGVADNLLLTIYLSSRCPIVIAPAMDLDMWKHPATQKNVDLLKELDVEIISVAAGELASGLIGEGRLSDPEEIFEYVDSKLNSNQDLLGKHVLITAGPTHEFIDPVRYIGNRSTGKMGITLAENCLARGAKVTLVLGPVNIIPPAKADIINVVDAGSMAKAVFEIKDSIDVFILAAAVADYTPEVKSDIKIKKKDSDLSLKLKRTIDIAKSLGENKAKNQIIVGFALETDSELPNAKNKLIKKNFDLIVLNSLKDKGAGFGYDTNKITILSSKDNKIKNFKLKTKDKVAQDIIDEIVLFDA